MFYASNVPSTALKPLKVDVYKNAYTADTHGDTAPVYEGGHTSIYTAAYIIINQDCLAMCECVLLSGERGVYSL